MAYVTLLSGVLIFFVITVYSAENDALKLINNIMPQQYVIRLKLYVEENIFLSECDININILKATDQISMFAEKLGIIQATLIKNVGYNQKVNYNVVGNKYDLEKNIISLYFKNKVTPGLYVLSMKFSNFFNEGFPQIYFSPSGERGVMWLFATHFQPTWAERIFPCWNKHKENTNWTNLPVFTFSIEHSKKYSVLSNTLIIKEEEHEDDIKWTHFYTTPRMSPYVTSIVVTDFAFILIDKDDVLSMWCKNQSASSLQFALTIARNITTSLYKGEWVRWRFPLRVKLIVIPDVSEAKFLERNDSLVHSGFIITKEANIIYNEVNDSIGHKYNVIRLLGYKVMQEFYEWIVNPYYEPSTWLSKGFATFTATHILNLTFPNLQMIDLFVVQIQHECLDFDVDKTLLPFSHKNKNIPKAKIIDDMKASIILRMLQHAFMSEVFWKAFETFTHDSSLRNKEYHLEIFWKALKDANDKIEPKKHDIKGMMHPWVEQKGYPVLIVIRIYNNFVSRISIMIENIDAPNEKRAIPVSYTTRTNLDFNQTRPQFWLKPPYESHKYKDTFNLDYREDSWVIFNIQQTGYYRVNYDDENWARISKYLNKGDYSKIHALNRAQLIDDAFQFMLWGKLKADIFWQLTKYLERETDYIAWYPMLKAIEYMSTSFQFSKELRLIKHKLGEMLHSLLGNIEYEEQLTDRDFTKALRQEAVRLTCSLNLYDCAGSAFIFLRQHLETNTKLTPWWKKWTYCYGLIVANNLTWHQTLNEIKRNDNDKILYLITCPNHLVKINTSITGPNDDIKSHITPSTIIQFELRHFVYTIVENIKNDEYNEEYNDEKDDKIYKHNTIFKNMLDNFTVIKPRQLKWSAALLILINNIYSIEHLNKVLYAFRKNEHNFKIRSKLEARKVEIDNHKFLFKRYI